MNALWAILSAVALVLVWAFFYVQAIGSNAVLRPFPSIALSSAMRQAVEAMRRLGLSMRKLEVAFGRMAPVVNSLHYRGQAADIGRRRSKSEGTG